MRRFAAVAVLLLCATIPAEAQTITVLLDHDITVGAGATITTTAADLLAHAEDRVVPSVWSTSTGSRAAWSTSATASSKSHKCSAMVLAFAVYGIGRHAAGVSSWRRWRVGIARFMEAAGAGS